MNTIRNTKRPKLATMLAVMALFVAIGGSATAASGLINGKKIKPGTVTAKQIKNKTITKGKLAPATISALRGPQGPKGEQGPKGDKGNPGPQGIPGTNDLSTFSADNHINNVPANTSQEALAFNNMTSSKYLVIAKVLMFAQTAGATATCLLETSNNSDGDEARWTAPSNNARSTVPLVVTTSSKVTQITIDCNPGASVGAFTVDAVVIPVK